MLKGSCLCGAVQFELTGEPLDTFVCHCSACRKCAGPNGSANLVVDSKDYRQTGETRSWARKGISGLDLVYDFCATCPTIVVARAACMGRALIVKPGLLDSAVDIEKFPPRAELFVKDRIDVWCERGRGGGDVELKETQ
ncbi:Mss4-like protein [Nemania sp. NC0429]|nr:Mss4-like protein [Nemania sp. NC0429]